MGSNVSQEVENVNNIITKNILDSITNISQNLRIEQVIKGFCSESDLKIREDSILKCIKGNLPLIEKKELTPKGSSEICSNLEICSISNVNLSESIIIDTTSDYSGKFDSKDVDKLSNDLSQLSSGSGIDQNITNITNQIQKSFNNIITNIKNNSNFAQLITANGISVQNVTISDCTKLVQKELENMSVISENVSEIANTVSQTSSNSSNLVLTAGLIIISSLVIVFLIVALSKSKDLYSFFLKILPFLIFFILAVIILIVFLLSKPDIVTKIDPKTDKPVIDYVKLIEYLTLIYSSLGVFITFFFYFYNKRNSSPKVRPMYVPRRSITTITKTETEN
jgi:hypothetical protein